MNKKIKMIISKICLMTVTFTTILSYNGTNNRVLAGVLAPENGIGSITFEEEREIADGVSLKSFNATSPTTNQQKGHTITFNPKEADVNVAVAYGDSVYSRKTVTSMVNNATKDGYTVIAGINGDFFQIKTGVPVGLTVQDARLIGANGEGWNAEGAKLEYWNALGFKKDGSAIIGHPDISLQYTVNGSSEAQNILQFNRQRNELGVFLYTADYSENTQTDMNSLDVVLTIEEGDVKLGQPIKCKVEKITEEVKYSPIEEGKLLLSSEVYTPGFWQLKKLNLGDEINILMTDKSGQWNDVVQAIGGYKLLLKNGEIQKGLDTTDHYPTTAVGIKENGEVVIFQVDGRQPDWSNGIPHNDTAHYLKSIGCIDALALDGGGSSTIAVKMPGEEKAKVVNKPSDGSERAVGDGLLLLAKAKRDNQFARLYTSSNKIKVEKGTDFKLDVKATDASYYPVSTPSNLTYEVSEGIGKTSANGVFTAGYKTGVGNIKISSGNVSTTVEVEVVSNGAASEAYLVSKATAQVESALKTKNFYDFNMALYQTTQLTDGDKKAVLLSKLATIEKLVWTEDVKHIYARLNELVATGSAKIYDEIQVEINNSNMTAVDKDYLLSELTSWGRDLVWTEDYKLAMRLYMDFFNNKDKKSADVAEAYIKQIKNSYSKDYLLSELSNLKKIYNI